MVCFLLVYQTPSRRAEGLRPNRGRNVDGVGIRRPGRSTRCHLYSYSKQGCRAVFTGANGFSEVLAIAYLRNHRRDVSIARIFNTLDPRCRSIVGGHLELHRAGLAKPALHGVICLLIRAH